MHEPNEEPVGIVDTGGDDDDDDFGDFDSAPTAQSEVIPGYSLAIAGAQLVQQEQHALSYDDAEPVVVQRARVLFPRLFARKDTAAMDLASADGVSSMDEILPIADVLVGRTLAVESAWFV
jgi:hypothetical protein